MIEATCAACGTMARIAEADVPVGAKSVTCASCKARVVLPPRAGTPPAGTPIKKSVAIPAIPSRPPPTPVKAKADTIDLADLPAPKRQSPLSGADASKPAPRSALASADLPAPKSAKPGARPHAPPGGLDLDALIPDLPAPKLADVGLADLPTPKPKSALADLPAPKPAPKSALADLPMPKPTPSALADLPAPKPKAALADLASPALPADDILDLPTPKAGADDLPAPKGFFDDLPQPAKAKAQGGIDLPAPKGFFDDLPQPAKGGGKSQEIAPKGFFDDLPKAAASQEIAPKGFFDDLPQPAKAKDRGSQELAPKPKQGFFDDLPQPSAKPPAPASGGLFDDLPQPSSEGSEYGRELDLSPGSPLELDGGGAAPELDLGLPLGQDHAFQDLDLGPPTTGPSARAGADLEPPSPIKIKTPSGGASPTPIAINVPSKSKPGDLKLDLADDPRGASLGAPAAAAAKKPVAKRAQASPEELAEQRAAKRRRQRMILGAVAGVALLGSGGFYFYQRHAAAEARAEKIAGELDKAQKALRGSDASHWQRAAKAAQAVLEIEATHPKALGIAAEAQIAGALDSGVNGPARIAQGRKYLQEGLGAGKATPELERAQAVALIASNQAKLAIPKLQALLAKEPKDGWLHLYMGWAALADGDAPASIKEFDQAAEMSKETQIAARYGHGRAKLLMADLEGAKAAFAGVLEVAKDHVCAQVGLAATLPPSLSAQREADLKAILARKDIETADPRCVTQAHTLIADGARNNGRLDIARESYNQALKVTPGDVPSLAGLAQVELRDGKDQVAADLVQKALAASAEDPGALMLQAEIFVHEGKLDDADKGVTALFDRKPPLATILLARLHVVKGKLLDAKGQDDDAATAYVEGAKLAGDVDLAPTMAAVKKLSALANKATDEAAAAAYRARADQLLSALAARADEDPQLSTTLGVAYLQAGDPAKAETFLRKSVLMRGDDAETKMQLAKALAGLGRPDEAIVQLTEAAALDPKRVDIQLELARLYQLGGRDTETIATYDRLLALPDVPIVARVQAGRFFARKGQIDRAASQAAPILDAEKDNPGGLFLKGEGLMKAGKWDEARITLNKAADADPEAQYLDGLGRALEGSLKASKDTKYIEGARFAYERASKADPKMLNPLVGQGRMLIARKEWDAALVPLLAAKDLAPESSEVMLYTGLAYNGLRNQKPEYRKVAAQWLDAALTKGQPPLDLERRAETAHRLGELYKDLSNAAKATASWELALSLGEQLEKAGGGTPEWLVEDYYYLGDLYNLMNQKPAMKRALVKYLDRKPKDEAHVKDATYKVFTELKNY